MASLTAQDRTVPEIKHALDVRCAVALGDYVKLFELAAVAPNMGGYLMDHFVAREQTLALQAMSKAYVRIHCIDGPRHRADKPRSIAPTQLPSEPGCQLHPKSVQA